MYRLLFKRLIDIVASYMSILVLSPVFIIVALLIKINMGGSVIFKQKRPGKQGKVFEMYKFRTMSNKKDEEGNLLPDSERITRLGRFLRATSLDELPELVNILKGDMSLIGPRPLLVQYLPLYTKEQAQRHLVRPGLTGYAQVKGRNSISWEEKFKLDTYYVNNYNFWLDVKIVFMTVFVIFKRSGVDSSEGIGMPNFTGSSDSISNDIDEIDQNITVDDLVATTSQENRS